MFLLAKVFRIPPFPFGGEREIYISRNSYENGHANKILENGSGEGGGGRGRRFMEDEKGEVGERDGPGGGERVLIMNYTDIFITLISPLCAGRGKGGTRMQPLSLSLSRCPFFGRRPEERAPRLTFKRT